MTIKVLEKEQGCLPKIIEKGEWIDLCTSREISLKAPYANMLKRSRKNKEDERVRIVDFNFTLIPLGICMRMPEGFEGILAPRSSTFLKYGILQSNSIGIIDQAFASDKDEWKMAVLATRDIIIPKGTRIAQFRIQLSQKATIWQKLKWLFSNKIKIKVVDSLEGEERSGFGSTGEK